MSSLIGGTILQTREREGSPSPWDNRGEWQSGLQLAVPLWCSSAQLLTLSLMTKLKNQENFYKTNKQTKTNKKQGSSEVQVKCVLWVWPSP